MVCAGEAGKEPCNGNGDGIVGGDDGGPLSTVVGAQHMLVGPFMAGLCILNVSIYVRFTPQPMGVGHAINLKGELKRGPLRY